MKNANYTAIIVFWWSEGDHDVNYVYKIETEAPYLDLSLLEEILLKYAEETECNVIEEALEYASEQLEFEFTEIEMVETISNGTFATVSAIDRWIEF